MKFLVVSTGFFQAVTQAKNQPAQQAYTFLKSGETEDGEWTYEELHVRSQAIAVSLQSLKNFLSHRAVLKPKLINVQSEVE